MTNNTVIIDNQRETQQKNLSNFLRNGKKGTSPYYTLKSSRKRAVLTGKLFKRAYQKESLIAWRNSFVPTEIFHAFGIIPFAAEGNCSMFASSDLANTPLNLAGENFYSRDTCSFLRCLAGTSVLDCMPTPDILVATTHYCDGAAKLFYNLSKKYNKPFFLLDVPYDYRKEEALDYLAGQIENLVRKLEKIFNLRLDPAKLTEAIHLSNQAREYFLKILDLRKNIPAPMLGGEALDYVNILTHTWGTKELVDIYKLLCEELLLRVKNHTGALKNEQHRILWRNLRPYYNNDILSYLEFEKQAVVAWEEVNYMHWDKLDPQKPYRSLARKLFSNPPVGPIQHWLDFTFRAIEEYRIDGIVEFAHWGCRHLNSSSQILKKNLEGKNIPFLIIDSDGVDSRNWSSGQIKTRIDAFIEILNTRKGH